MCIRSIAGDTNWVEGVHYGTENGNCLAGQCSVTTNYSKKLFAFQGWVECVGCADRSAFDLTQHTKATGVRLAAEKKLAEPKIVDVTGESPNCYCGCVYIDASFELCIRRILSKHTVSEYGDSTGKGCVSPGYRREYVDLRGGSNRGLRKQHHGESHNFVCHLSLG